MPQQSGTNKSILKNTRVVLNTNLLSTPITNSLNENLLQREVFDYDFTRERVFLEIAAAEMEAKRKANEKEATEAAMARRGLSSLSLNSDDNDASELEKGAGVSPAKAQTRARTSSADDVVAALEASLREY